ncbi:hypothetical protein FBU30_002682 [Linnemannia zychae]|nr:hypothetical protein FBU30_002682 [Linnemannia zychae]
MRSIPSLFTFTSIILFAFLSSVTLAQTPKPPIPTNGNPTAATTALWSWQLMKETFFGIPYIYLVVGCGILLALSVFIGIFFYFRKKRGERRYRRLKEIATLIGGGNSPGITGSDRYGDQELCRQQHQRMTYIYREPSATHYSLWPPSHISNSHSSSSGAPWMNEAPARDKQSIIYYSENAPIQIQTHDPVTGYPFPQGQVQFYELSIDVVMNTTSPKSEKNEDLNGCDKKDKEGKKTAISLDQLPERLYSHPPQQLRHKASSPSVSSSATLPVSTPSHLQQESGSDNSLKKPKVQTRKDPSPAPVSAINKAKANKAKVQLKRETSISKDSKARTRATTTTRANWISA